MAQTLMANHLIEVSDLFESRLFQLFDAAAQAKGNAYCRYSGFRVGAALLMNDGKVITGCNVENQLGSLIMCAERVAIFKAVSEGYSPGDIQAVAIASSGKNFAPCGPCREVLSEFRVNIVVFEFDDEIVIAPLSHLLPFRFDLSKAS
jgi:cytidine deaminase